MSRQVTLTLSVCVPEPILSLSADCGRNLNCARFVQERYREKSEPSKNPMPSSVLNAHQRRRNELQPTDGPLQLVDVRSRTGAASAAGTVCERLDLNLYLLLSVIV